MSDVRSQHYCPSCRQMRMFIRERPNHILHLLLTVFTLGIWLLIWPVVSAAKASQRPCCSVCGTKYDGSTRFKDPSAA